LAKPPAFDRCISLLLYQPPASQLINRFKFNKGYAHGRVLATLFSQHLANVYQGSYPDCVIPLPLDYQRLRQRGYNQSAVILHHLSKQLKLKVKNNLVKRIKLTTQQHKLNTRQRKANIKGAFVVNKPLPYEHIAVLDDIVTSGATANEISRVIKQAGVDKVDIWSLARTPLDAQKR
jgi:ComF family protein